MEHEPLYAPGDELRTRDGLVEVLRDGKIVIIVKLLPGQQIMLDRFAFGNKSET